MQALEKLRRKRYTHGEAKFLHAAFVAHRICEPALSCVESPLTL
jgi:hypothetical protein